MKDILLKHPTSTKDFTVPWAGSLNGATISNSTFTVSPSGLTLSNPTSTSTTTKVRTAGGTDGVAYEITNTVTLSDGQVLTYTFQVMVTTLGT